eukprot:7046955-Ditylum_brightwellii.AAC.1
MERKRYVPPFVIFGPTKRPTVGVPKGSWKAVHSVDRKLCLWSYMDSSLVFILDACWGGRREPFIRMNKQTGEKEHIGECPKALNYFNQAMYSVDCWDLIHAPKHGRYSVEMYSRVGKWTM